MVTVCVTKQVSFVSSSPCSIYICYVAEIEAFSNFQNTMQVYGTFTNASVSATQQLLQPREVNVCGHMYMRISGSNSLVYSLRNLSVDETF